MEVTKNYIRKLTKFILINVYSARMMENWDKGKYAGTEQIINNFH